MNVIGAMNTILFEEGGKKGMKRAAEILRPFNDGPRNSNFHVIHFLSSAGKHFILGTPTVRKFSFSCVDAGQPSVQSPANLDDLDLRR